MKQPPENILDTVNAGNTPPPPAIPTEPAESKPGELTPALLARQKAYIEFMFGEGCLDEIERPWRG